MLFPWKALRNAVVTIKRRHPYLKILDTVFSDAHARVFCKADSYQAQTADSG